MKGYKKIWITDNCAEDNQFWIKTWLHNVFDLGHLRWTKYKKTKNGKWIKYDHLGTSTFLKKIAPSVITWEEWQKISNET